MKKTDLMKQYEAETGRKPKNLFMSSEESLIHFTREYVEWLEAQLTWRQVSEKPKEGQIVFTMIPTGWVVAQYLHGEFYVEDGFTFGDFISGVSHWLPIPPVPEVEEGRD